MTESDTEEVKCVGPLPESETNQIEGEEQKDQSDHGSIYASSSVSGFTNSSLPRRKIIHVETGTCRLNFWPKIFADVLPLSVSAESRSFKNK